MMNYRSTKLLLSTIVLMTILFLISCKSPFQVVNISNQYVEEPGLIYSLPQTKIIVDIEITEIKRTKGPFAEYTGLYFNSKNAVVKNEVEYKITDVSLTTTPIKDPKNIYVVNANENLSMSMLNLTPEGFLAGINLSDYQAEKVQTEQKVITKAYTKENKLDYADFSLKSIRETSYDTLYKEVLRDSVIVKVPIIKKKKVFKSPEKQAKEIADIIFLLRDDRNALLKGENDGNNFPDGEGLKIMVEELNKLEQQYMSLFTGIEKETSLNYKFEFVPDIVSNSFQIINFSENKGITDNENDQKVLLNIHPDQTITKITDFNRTKLDKFLTEGQPLNGLIYRVPAEIIAEISIDNRILYKKQIRISQMGTISVIPGDIINNQTTIEFYPQEGSLKRISKERKTEDKK